MGFNFRSSAPVRSGWSTVMVMARRLIPAADGRANRLASSELVSRGGFFAKKLSSSTRSDVGSSCPQICSTASRPASILLTSTSNSPAYALCPFRGVPACSVVAADAGAACFAPFASFPGGATAAGPTRPGWSKKKKDRIGSACSCIANDSVMGISGNACWNRTICRVGGGLLSPASCGSDGLAIALQLEIVGVAFFEPSKKRKRKPGDSYAPASMAASICTVNVRFSGSTDSMVSSTGQPRDQGSPAVKEPGS